MNKGKYIKPTRTICYQILDDVLPLVKETVELYRSAASHCLSVLKDNTELLRAKDDPDAVTSRKYDLFSIVERLIHRTKSNPKPWYPLDVVGKNLPAYMRRSAINSAIGTAGKPGVNGSKQTSTCDVWRSLFAQNKYQICSERNNRLILLPNMFFL